MIRDDLEGAPAPVLGIITEQGEKRLEAQCSFADAQDTRGTSLINAAAALAAAALALGGGSFATLGRSAPLTIGSLVAVAGFTAAACVALWALRSDTFHSCGWYPADFVEDLRAGRSADDLRRDFALDLQHRLSQNAATLDTRGRRLNAAAVVMIVTPLAALAVAYVAT